MKPWHHMTSQWPLQLHSHFCDKIVTIVINKDISRLIYGQFELKASQKGGLDLDET